jgi:hypothetical protein
MGSGAGKGGTNPSWQRMQQRRAAVTAVAVESTLAQETDRTPNQPSLSQFASLERVSRASSADLVQRIG